MDDDGDEAFAQETSVRSWRVCNADGCFDIGRQDCPSSQTKRALNGPTPVTNFGRKAHLLGRADSHVDPSEHYLAWAKPPVNVLVIKKAMDSHVTRRFMQVTRWLVEVRKLTVFVEKSIKSEHAVLNDGNFKELNSNLCPFEQGEHLEDKIDFIICLGGDGTLLHISNLFQESCPPVIAFHMGSLGFLTSFKFDNFEEKISKALDGNVGLTLRSRLQCEVKKLKKDNDLSIKSSRYMILNEVVVDRGPSSYLSNLDVYCNDELVTSVQGDGLIVSTPTGSTAYAVAAGASMVHPSVPAILVTPVCPHSLSFRPIVLPAGVVLQIVVNPESRNNAWVSFDGRNRQELQIGDCLRIRTSRFPVPSINCENQVKDWFTSLAECLHWNVRQKQRQLSITDCHV